MTTHSRTRLPQNQRDLVRLLICGSVDDGKSTLLGRLLFDTQQIATDTLAALERDSKVHGTTGGGFDPALVTDGLRAEREQGITIDVAYRYFASGGRTFIIADTPGHAQYTRNMATGASTADLAILLIDARRGVVEQTRRHSFVASLLGIRHVIVAVNKMDLVGFDERVFQKIVMEYEASAARLQITDLRFIPLSALHGDNVVHFSDRMPWYTGGTLLHTLDSVHVASDRNMIDLRFPVQYVLRPSSEYRGYCGTIASGILRAGDTVSVLPSGAVSTVAAVEAFGCALPEAFPPMAVTVRLTDEIDVSRGDMIVHRQNVPACRNTFDAMIIWMDEEELVPGKQYVFRHTTRFVTGTVDVVRYRVDMDTFGKKQAATLAMNDIGRCSVMLTQPIACDAYEHNRATGAFVVIDRITNRTVAAGMIVERHVDPTPVQGAVQDSALCPEHSRVSPRERMKRLRQQPATVLLTGLSGAGKSTIAYALEERLFRMGYTSMVLDGENMRLGLTQDLGFDERSRQENVRRTMEVARLLNDAGILCICALVAPSERMRSTARERIGADRFFVVHVDAPLDVCQRRHRKGLYAAVDEGKLRNVPGKTSSYEVPASPDLCIATHELSPDECVDRIVLMLTNRGILLT